MTYAPPFAGKRTSRRAANHERAADDIADRYGNEVADEKLLQVNSGKSAAVLTIALQK